jgi:lysophospholipase L1-like esterase
MDNDNNRRDFLKTAGIAGVASLVPFELFASALPAQNPGSTIKLKDGDVILFQGDSITDAGRNKEQKDANFPKALGSGYSLLAAASILKKNAGRELKIYNRGISGNKVFQLADRWEQDCMEIKPTVLSILIGVNDFWHAIDGKYDGTVDTYKKDFQALLTRTKDKLPDVKLIIGEPFAVIGVKSVTAKWYPAFNEYRAAAKEIASQFKASFIPYQSIFDKALKDAAGSYWTIDGVHPSLAGCQLMADAWLDHFNKD